MPHATLRGDGRRDLRVYDEARRPRDARCAASIARDRCDLAPRACATRWAIGRGRRRRRIGDAAAPAQRGIAGTVARAAVAIRHKLPGRILYRLAPASLVERLKRHLG